MSSYVDYTEVQANQRADAPEKEMEALLGTPSVIANVPSIAKFVVGEDFADYWGRVCIKWFLGKIEGPISSAVLSARQLLRPSTDHAIIAELGGHLKARITCRRHILRPREQDT